MVRTQSDTKSIKSSGDGIAELCLVTDNYFKTKEFV